MRLPNLSALSLYAPTSADASGVADGDREDRPILLDDSDDEVVVLSEDDGNDTEPGEDSGNDTEIGEDDDDYPVAPGVTVVEGVEVERNLRLHHHIPGRRPRRLLVFVGLSRFERRELAPC